MEPVFIGADLGQICPDDPHAGLGQTFSGHLECGVEHPVEWYEDALESASAQPAEVQQRVEQVVHPDGQSPHGVHPTEGPRVEVRRRVLDGEGHGIGDAPQWFLQVMRCRMGERIEVGVRDAQSFVECGQFGLVPQHETGQRAPELLCGGAVGRRPGQALPAYQRLEDGT